MVSLTEVAVIYVPITVSPDAPLGETSFIVRPVFQTCDDYYLVYCQPLHLTWVRAWDDVWHYCQYKHTSNLPKSLHRLYLLDTFSKFDSSVFSKIHAGIEAPTNNEITFDAFGLHFP